MLLPLFPLSAALAPGQPLALHVFEPRYRALVADLLAVPDAAGRRFGVVAIRRGHEVGGDAPELHPVGCTAQLVAAHPHADGRYDLETVGGVRFRLRAVGHDRPYLTAVVELLPEVAGEHAAELAARARSAYDGYADALSALGFPAEEPRGLPADPIALSYALSAATVLDTAERQALLELPDAATRLTRLVGLLRRETAIVRHVRAVPGASVLRSTPLPAN